VKIGLVALLWASAAVAEPAAVQVLEDFERAGALAAWELDVGASIEEGVALLRYRRRRGWQLWRDPWPSLRLGRGEGLFGGGDWSAYDRLEFTVANAEAVAALLKLRLDDAGGTRATRLFALPPQSRQTYRVDLGLLGREIDLGRMALMDLYMSHPVRDYALTLDDIVLVAEKPDLTGAELLDDPFGGGRIRVRSRRGRNLLYRVEIRDDLGQPIADHVEQAQQLDWTWAGGEPGRYRVALSATDLAWDGGTASAELGAFVALPEARRPTLAAWREPTTRKVMRDAQPRPGQPIYSERVIGSEEGEPLRLEMARNEVEGVQIAFRSTRSIALSLQVEELRHQTLEVGFPTENIELFQVGYVFTRRPKEYAVDHAGWWPDPLLPRAQWRVRPEECQVAWLSLAADVGVAPGVYSGRLGVWVDDARLGSIPLEVRVYDAELPVATTVRTAFSLYQDMLDQVYGPERARKLRRRYLDFIVAHRLNIDHLYRRQIPDLDELADYARQGRLNAFNLRYLDAREKYDREGLSRLVAELDPAVERLRELDLIDRAYIYGFDEVEVDEFDKMERVFAFIKARYPELKTATTARDPGLGLDHKLGEVVDIWVPLSAVYERQTAALARQRGDEVWWYICVSPTHPHANWFVEYPALEARLLWWMAYQRGIEGFLYYAMNRWPDQQMPLSADAYGRSRWNPASYGTANGDGALFYAGVDGPITSIRLENVRDGIEDYELLVLLATKAGAAKAQELSARLARSATDYSRDPVEFARVRRALLEAVAAKP
jgi:hypothetical protein